MIIALMLLYGICLDILILLQELFFPALHNPNTTYCRVFLISQILHFFISPLHYPPKNVILPPRGNLPQVWETLQ